MEHPNNNRSAWLLSSTSPEPAHVPTQPPDLISESQAAAMEAVAAEVYSPTPEPPLPTNPDTGLSDSTLVPTRTPEGMVAINVDSSPPPEALVAPPVVHSPTPQLVTDGAALVLALENADDVPEPAPGLEGILYFANPAPLPAHVLEAPAGSLISTSPLPAGWEDTPSPDSIYERKAEALYDAWLVYIGRMNPKTFEKLNIEYSANTVGNLAIWRLACWMHRAPAVRVREFLRAQSPPTPIIEAIQHAFATRLTRLRGRIIDHGTHADSVRTVLEEWNAGIGLAALPISPALPSPSPSTIEAMREAVPSPIVPVVPGDALALDWTSKHYLAPISISSGSSTSSVVLIHPHEKATIERALRRVARHTPARPALSRRPSITFREASGAPDDLPEDAVSDSSSTPTATPAVCDFPERLDIWQNSTPSNCSSIPMAPGDNDQVPILVDTPEESVEMDHTRSPPADMGRPRGDGRMTAAGRDHVSPSPDVPRWAGNTQEQEAKAVMDELHILASSRLPARTDQEALTQLTAGDAPEVARNWADDIAPQRIGYGYYLQSDVLPPLAGGTHDGPEGALSAAFQLTAATLGAGIGDPRLPANRVVNSDTWFHGAAATLASLIRGILVSDQFFKQGGYPVKPCSDIIQLPPGIAMPDSQVELLQAMTSQLLSELSAQGVSRLARPELWQAIYDQERDVLREQVRSSDFAEVWMSRLRTSLQQTTAEEAIRSLIATFEAEGAALKEQATLAERVAAKVARLCTSWEADLNGLVEQERISFEHEWRSDFQRAASKEAEREWRLWKDGELAKAKAEAMNQISLEYVLQMCGDDAAKLVEEKRQFAKEYVAANYQAWVAQELEARWPQVEQTAQGYTRERYLQEELNRIWPDVRDEARADVAERVVAYKANLERNLTKAADEDHRMDAAIQRSVGKTKAAKTRVKDIKKERQAMVDSKRTVALVANATEALIARAVTDTADYENGVPNGMHQLGVAVGIIDPFTQQSSDEFSEFPALTSSEGARNSEAPGSSEPAPTHSSEAPPSALRDVHSSMHAPQNRMEDDPPAPVVEPPASLDVLITAVRELLAPIQAGQTALFAKVEELDRRTRTPRTTHPLPPRPAPIPAPLPDTTLDVADVDISMEPLPAPIEVDAAPSPPPPGGARTADGTTANAPSPDSVTAPEAEPVGARTAEAEPISDAPSPPSRRRRAKGKSASTADAEAQSTAAPSPQRAPPAKGNTTGARTADPNDGFVQVGRPRPAYNIVTSKGAQQNAASEASAKANAAAQGRNASGTLKRNPISPSPADRTITHLVVIRHGGLSDEEEERKLRSTNPGYIVSAVRTEIERRTLNPLKLLGGRWSREVAKTGNFVYHIAGKVPMEAILPFSTHLLKPFPGATLVPATGWCWAQLRDVLTSDRDDYIYEEDTLLAELRLNPVFETVPIVQAPHWAQDPFTISTTTSTVVFAYIDDNKPVTQAAIAGGISMFSYGVKFVFAGDSPRPKQCGRCFEMGHVSNDPACKWKGKNRCLRCGSDHHMDDHTYHCKGSHTVAGKCDCKFKCLLCGKLGHNARAWRGCPSRGDFPPPRQVPRIEPPQEIAPVATAPRAILKRPTEMSTPTPPARVDDDPRPLTPPLFNPTDLANETPPIEPTPAEAAKQAPKARPRARIVRPNTDTAKLGETSTERAAARARPASPSSLHGALALDVAKTKDDEKLKRLGAAMASLAARPTSVRGTGMDDEGAMRPQLPLERLAEMYPSPPAQMNIPSAITTKATQRHRYMADEVKADRILVMVAGRSFACPFADLSPRFHALRRQEEALLLRIMEDDDSALSEPVFWNEAEYETAALNSRAFGGHDHLGAELAEPTTPTAIPSKNRPVLPYA
ncbi:hypothetical protein EDB85DRAFT_2163497 [Lactarius pseudohatsudake]|nr:hypothetical protein EDB85DRAFT_2163497 [Lactarius pseudohatsudake]